MLAKLATTGDFSSYAIFANCPFISWSGGFEFNKKDTDLQRSQVFHGVRRQWPHPLGTRDLRRVRLAAIEQNVASLIAPDEMAPTLKIGYAAPAMSVQRNYISRSDVGMEYPHPLVFEQQLMVGGRSYERIEPVRPGPGF